MSKSLGRVSPVWTRKIQKVPLAASERQESLKSEPLLDFFGSAIYSIAGSLLREHTVCATSESRCQYRIETHTNNQAVWPERRNSSQFAPFSWQPLAHCWSSVFDAAPTMSQWCASHLGAEAKYGREVRPTNTLPTPTILNQLLNVKPSPPQSWPNISDAGQTLSQPMTLTKSVLE